MRALRAYRLWRVRNLPHDRITLSAQNRMGLQPGDVVILTNRDGVSRCVVTDITAFGACTELAEYPARNWLNF